MVSRIAAAVRGVRNENPMNPPVGCGVSIRLPVAGFRRISRADATGNGVVDANSLEAAVVITISHNVRYVDPC